MATGGWWDNAPWRSKEAHSDHIHIDGVDNASVTFGKLEIDTTALEKLFEPVHILGPDDKPIDNTTMGTYSITVGDSTSDSNPYDSSTTDFQWSASTTSIVPAPGIPLPEGMTEDEAKALLTTCVVCEDPAPGICPTCKEAIQTARAQMLKDWMRELEEFKQAG
jgi:hypothetical protein